MKKLLALLMLLPLAVFTLGCDSVDDDDIDVGDDPTAIYGTWVSEGDDIAPGLAALFGTTRITAVFNANNTYEVTELRAPGDPAITYTGTYSTTATATGNIRSISLTQGVPFGAEAQGIYEVNPAQTTMRYEVIQVQPDIGAVPPSASAGFGSTVIGGTPQGSTWVQNYVKVQ